MRGTKELKGELEMRQWVRQVTIVLIVVAATVIATLSLSSQAQPAWRTTWEYKVISTYGPSETSPPPNIEKLDKAGTEGWELIDIRVGSFGMTSKPGSTQVRTDYYFKRAK
jgi:hypothetical protein